MADERLEKELTLARRAAPSFGLARQQRVIWGVRRRLGSGKLRMRQLLPLAAAACVAGLALAGYHWRRPSESQLAVTDNPRDERWELRDGSRVLIETPATRITKQREVDGEVLFELAAGAARFDVARRPERAFRVQAGAVQVEVVGTRFRVERQSEHTLVSVERGRVKVSWALHSQVLSAGESGVFPPNESVVATRDEARKPLASAEVNERADGAVNTRGSAAPTTTTPSATPPTTLQNAEELFATADRARASSQPLQATQALRELTQRFPRDRRAPLAAFTLGRLLLENLAQPAEAARAFAQARALSSRGSALAEDALAREAEALRAAGNVAEAAKRAELYRAQYPNGARMNQVLRAGGLSPRP